MFAIVDLNEGKLHKDEYGRILFWKSTENMPSRHVMDVCEQVVELPDVLGLLDPYTYEVR